MLSFLKTLSTRLPRGVGCLAQAVAVVVPLLVTLDRFRRPSSERFIFPSGGGSADLWLPYLGARAILAHLDPYGPLPAYLREPSGWPTTYPPTMLALYVPLVVATRSKIALACQVFYWLNIVALGALSFITWQLSLRLVAPRQRRGSPFLVPLIALSLNVLTMFALERGQSEIVSAALCWGAVLLFVRGQMGWAMAAVTLAGAIKGYAVPLGVGLLLATRGWKQFLRAVAGATVVTLAVTVPVARYLKHGFESMLMRADFSFIPTWYNHSFKNTFYQFSPSVADSGRRWTIIFACVVMCFALWRLIIAVRRGTNSEVTLRATLFAGISLALGVGMPAYAGPYNLVLVLPAMILASTRFGDVYGALKLHRWLAVPIGLVLVVALYFALRLRSLDSETDTLAGIGLIAFIACVGALTAAGSKRVTTFAAKTRASQ